MAKIIISSRFKEAFNKLSTNKDFETVIEWLKMQKNNLAVIEWTRTRSNDPELAIKKARFEGNIETINLILETIEISRKGEDNG